MVLLGRKDRTNFTQKSDYVAAYTNWTANNPEVLPTATHLLGLFYLRYKQKYRLFPCSDIREDLQNMKRFITEFMSEDLSLAPFVIEYFFSLPQFNGIQTGTFCNRNVLSKWSAFERAEKLRSHVGIGEQSEFRSDSRSYGVVRV